MIHKLSWFYSVDQMYKEIGMLCTPKLSGTNSDPKSVNWNNVTCKRCLGMEKTELPRTNNPMAKSRG